MDPFLYPREATTLNTELNADEKAFRHIIAAIVSHKLHPGDRIYEPSLSQELGLSRTPIRHAINRCVSEGLLEKSGGQKGYAVPILTPEDMEQVFQAREAIEGQTAFLAALRAEPDEIAELRRLNRLERETFESSTRDEYAELNKKFHFLVADMSRNVYLKRYVTQVYWRSQLYTFYLGWFYSLGTEGSQRAKHHVSHIEHAEIIDALERKDPDGARDRIVRHLRATYHVRFLPGSER